MVAKIALEEHVLFDCVREYWEPTVKDLSLELYRTIHRRLTDFGDERLAAMDGAGIDIAVLSVSGPGVQVETDASKATRKAREANEELARELTKRPGRYRGFAHLAMQDVVGAAEELERCVREYGFVGAMINGHTNGRYLDDPMFYPFWERAEALDVAVYLHPADPPVPYVGFEGHKALARATWGWTMETGTHALRLVFSGLFDRFPGSKFVLGHMGETLPYQLWRFDSRARLYGAKLKLPPSETIKRNIYVTISGMFSPEPLRCAVDALGCDHVMFAADYPFETITEASRFMDTVAIEEDLRRVIAHDNAARLLKL